MITENPQENMTFGELLELIGDQQRRLTVMENAFSFLAFCLDEKNRQLLIHNLRLESQNQTRDAALQQHFSHLASQLEEPDGINQPRPDIS